ncbi:Protein kinase domain-containing protein [Promicromonospora umidemergens]|uniref:non-specific serine/threonine protein kinase n=1 Tax=Promicromonospora umidemergens TaxID=629679 RepID=A0ABP8XUQ4_9MICO|nr:serine/threonine-protein kinase [Promicromonospora umidemergens]MCP2286064.1 Protein kinase domain-containing protein [Promicromonospora umidemergens]
MSDQTTRMTAANSPGQPAQGGDHTAAVPPPPAPTRVVSPPSARIGPPPTAPTEIVQPSGATRGQAARQAAPLGQPEVGNAALQRIPATGETLGPYQLLGSLGHGGFAHVYRATGQGGEVALKVLTNSEHDSLDRFVGEAALLERLAGRGFPQLVTADLQSPTPWFAMELVPGPTLSQRVAADGPMPPHEVLRVADDVLDALAVLQEEHFLHRDVKPANIIAAPDRYVLIDLGIAKGHGTSTSTHAAGTISYMAPELFVRKPHARSDVYSLGLLLIFLATGELPNDLNFAGRDLTAADVGPVDQRLLPLVLAMTRHRPEDRPPLHNLIGTVAQLAADGARLDPTLLAAADATTVERGLVTEVLTGSGAAAAVVAPTSVLASNPVRQDEPVTNLVYDQQLMGRLHQVHGDGFDGAAEDVISVYLSAVGPQRAGGRTPAEVKDYLWAAMRWVPAFTPEGYADTYDGWVAYRQRHGLPLPGVPTASVPRRQAGSPTQHRAPVTNQQATQVAPAFRPGPTPGARPAQTTAPAPAQRPVGQGSTQPSAPVRPAAPPAKPAPRREDRDARADKRRDSGGGLGALAAIIGWVPRILLAIAVYQLIRLFPGFDAMPSAAGLPLFAALGDLSVAMLNLDPVWAPRMAELSIPLLGIVTSALVNLFRAVRTRRGGRTWPFWLVVVVWVIVIAVQGVVGYAQQATENARESFEQQREQIQDDLEQGVQDTTEDVRDSLWESFENALPWS